MRRVAARNEVHLVKAKVPLRRASDRKMSRMDWIERAPEKSDTPAARRIAAKPAGWRCAQLASVSGSASSSVMAVLGASRSRASAMARTRMGMPSPEAEEMA